MCGKVAALRWCTGVALLGALCVVLGEALRKVAILTARRNFTHLIRTERAQEHQLVRHGVYSLMRHPSYCGWFLWALGTQLLLVNPTSLLRTRRPFLRVLTAVVVARAVFAYVSFNFFARRIPFEEHYLQQFFGSG